jgi:hypothetical protein
MNIRTGSVVWVLAIGLASGASTQGVEGVRSVGVSLGTGLGLGGNVINEGVGVIEGTPAVFVEQAYSNHYSDAFRLRFTGSYGLDYNKEAFVSFSYGRFNGTERITGSVGGFPLYTRFSNGDAFDIDGGLRYYFLPEGPTRTYVAGVIGLRFLQSTDVTIRIRELGLAFEDLPYFKSSTLFLIGGDAGISRDLSDTIAVGAEIGIRFQPKPGAENVFADPALAVVNDTGSRWSLPISGFLTVRF